MACASAIPGAAASASAQNDAFLYGHTSHPPSAPKRIAPQTPRPPCQILSASTGWPFLPQYGSGVVITWYSRAPIRPSGTAAVAASAIVPSLPPRARHRRSAGAPAAVTPAVMQDAEAPMGAAARWPATPDGPGGDRPE